MMDEVLRLFVFSVAIGLSQSIDLELDRISCDRDLPIYPVDDDLRFECEGSQRCTFGETATIRGTLYYDGALEAGLSNSTAKGYAVGELSLMNYHYQLFDGMPVEFCGDWIERERDREGDEENDADNDGEGDEDVDADNDGEGDEDNDAENDGNRALEDYDDCPADGVYNFDLDYTLPENHDYTTWFATGWTGVATLEIYNDTSHTALLASCEMHFHTYTTESEHDAYGTLPSAAMVSLIAVAVIACMLMTICCIVCTPRRKHVSRNEMMAYRLAP